MTWVSYPIRRLAEAENAGFAVISQYYLSVPAAVGRDPQRLALAMDILSYLSTREGQQAILADSLHMSNIKGVDLSDNPAAKYVEEAYSRGNLYPLVSFSNARAGYYTLLQDSVLSVINGGGVAEAAALVDRGVAQQLAAPPAQPQQERVIATAESDFTMLETSYYLADQLREAGGAEIALMLNGSFFRSNLATIRAGDITDDMSRFVMKGVGAEDYLTSYSLSGAQLRQLLEHPLVNGVEIDALLAASGLSLEYAPWNERGGRVLSLTLADGSPLEDDRLYTVAAWAGVIDEQYITQTLQAHEELGSLCDILLKALEEDGSISPDLTGRVTLVWPE